MILLLPSLQSIPIANSIQIGLLRCTITPLCTCLPKMFTLRSRTVTFPSWAPTCVVRWSCTCVLAVIPTTLSFECAPW